MRFHLFTPIFALACALGVAGPARAQQEPAGDASQDLAKQLSNPIANLISVPLQQNIDFGQGPDGDGVKMTLNIQPVVPLSINEDWNLIVRTILPVVFQDNVTMRGAEEFGTGDVVQSFFFSPKESSGGITWGVGPVINYPIATDSALGTEKLGIGPTAVVLKQSGPNTFGLLANHLWSIAGDDDRSDISATFLQPFFSHTTPDAVTYSFNTETTYDWKNEQWVVPLNFTVTKLTKIGAQPVSVGGGVKYYAEKPQGGPDWGIRLILTFLFPKG